MKKLDLFKQRDEQRPKEVGTLFIDQKAQLEALAGVQKAVEGLHTLINDQEPLDLSELSEQLQTLHKTLDFSEQFKALQEEIRESKVETVDVKQFTDLIEAVKENRPLPVKIDLSKLEKAIIEVQQRVQDASLPNQAPEDYTAVRRVIKVGSRLVFDDSVARGGGGGGGGSLSYGTLANIVTGSASNTDGTSTPVISAQGVGVKTYITDVTLTNTSDTAVYVELKNGSTSKWTLPVPANTAGVVYSFATPLPGEDNTGWNFDPSSAVATVICSLNGFRA